MRDTLYHCHACQTLSPNRDLSRPGGMWLVMFGCYFCWPCWREHNLYALEALSRGEEVFVPVEAE